MKIEKKTHWKNYHNPNYIGAYAFQPNEHKILRIKSINTESVKSERGEEMCLVIYFFENEKPFICNVTNAKSISKVCDSSYIEDWVSKHIELYVAKIKAFGEFVEAVRVKSTKPNIKKETLSQDSQRWTRAVQQLAENKITIEEIKKYVVLSDDDEKEILFQADELAAKLNEEQEEEE